jgi:hypothetical protein
MSDLHESIKACMKAGIDLRITPDQPEDSNLGMILIAGAKRVGPGKDDRISASVALSVSGMHDERLFVMQVDSVRQQITYAERNPPKEEGSPR